jgi:hypothetical protein
VAGGKRSVCRCDGTRRRGKRAFWLIIRGKKGRAGAICDENTRTNAETAPRSAVEGQPPPHEGQPTALQEDSPLHAEPASSTGQSPPHKGQPSPHRVSPRHMGPASSTGSAPATQGPAPATRGQPPPQGQPPATRGQPPPPQGQPSPHRVSPPPHGASPLHTGPAPLRRPVPSTQGPAPATGPAPPHRANPRHTRDTLPHTRDSHRATGGQPSSRGANPLHEGQPRRTGPTPSAQGPTPALGRGVAGGSSTEGERMTKRKECGRAPRRGRIDRRAGKSEGVGNIVAAAFPLTSYFLGEALCLDTTYHGFIKTLRHLFTLQFKSPHPVF